MKYKLLVLDLDGTLTNNKKEITEHTLRTLIDAQERGVKIVLASGRPTYGIASFNTYSSSGCSVKTYLSL